MEEQDLFEENPGYVADKIAYLLKLFEVPREQFVSEFRSMLRSDEGVELQSADVEAYIKGYAIAKDTMFSWLTKYWRKFFTDLEVDLWRQKDVYFFSNAYNYLNERSNIVIKGQMLLNEYSDTGISDLCGQYEIFRYSFNNDGAISLEHMKLTPITGTKLSLSLEYRQPSILDETAFDKFIGKMHYIGKMYWGFSYFFLGHDRRMQSIYLPESQTPEISARWGILTGMSAKNQVPVSVRFVARKVTSDVDKNLGEPRRISISEVPSLFVDYISNDIQKDDRLPIRKASNVKPVALSVG